MYCNLGKRAKNEGDGDGKILLLQEVTRAQAQHFLEAMAFFHKD